MIGSDRAELLLDDQRVVGVDVRDQRGRVEVARLVRLRVGAEQHARTGVRWPCRTRCGDDVVLGLVLQRAQHVVLVQAHAHRHVLRDLGQRLADLFVDVLVHVEALQRRAGLAGVDERAPEQVLGDGLRVRVGQHDAGVVAAQFQGQPLHGVGGGADDGLAGGGGAGEHDLVDVLVGAQQLRRRRGRRRPRAARRPGAPG